VSAKVLVGIHFDPLISSYKFVDCLIPLQTACKRFYRWHTKGCGGAPWQSGAQTLLKYLSRNLPFNATIVVD